MNINKMLNGKPAVYTPSENNMGCRDCHSYNYQVLVPAKQFKVGGGIIGMLLFGWIGLLFGLFTDKRSTMQCRDCGCTWKQKL